MRNFFVFAFLTLFFSFTGESKTFRSQFMRFELPQNWDCKQEELDWACQPDNLAERNEVILVIVTKTVDENDDNFDRYENILKTPKNMRDLLGNSYMSQVKYTRRLTIMDQVWVDSLHFGSEIPGFFTRYLASIKEKVAGLVTYSVAETAYPKWATEMDKVVNTLKIQFDPKAFAELKDKGGSPLLGQRGSARRLPPSLEDIQEGRNNEEEESPMTKILAFLVILGAVGFIIYKRKQQGKT